MKHRTDYLDLHRPLAGAPVGPYQVDCTCGYQYGPIPDSDDAEFLQRLHYRQAHSAAPIVDAVTREPLSLETLADLHVEIPGARGRDLASILERGHQHRRALGQPVAVWADVFAEVVA